MDGYRFHPINPPGKGQEDTFMVDSLSTCYLATAEAELEGTYLNPYPHIPWSEDLRKKGFEICVDPKVNVWHVDLERLGVGRQPLPIPWSMTPYITSTGQVYSPQQTAAQMYHLSLLNMTEWLYKNRPGNFAAMNAFLKTRPLITASYKVFNGADYIKESLQSIYDYVDCIDIIEGAVKLRMVDGEFRSTDGTLEILEEFPDTKKKIRLIQKANKPYNDKQEMQNQLLEMCRSKWMLFIDSDEIIEGMDILRKFAEKNPDGNKVYARPEQFINLIHDFEHFVYSDNPFSPWASMGLPHPFLIHRDIPGLNFGRFHTIPTDGFDIPIHSDSKEYQGRRQILDGVIVYHFGNVLPEEKLKAKLTFERKRGFGWNKDEKGNLVPVEQNFLYTGELTEDMHVQPFDKESLPESLHGHPFYNRKPLIESWTDKEGRDHFKFL
jgi:hypothetical protein